MPQIRSKNASNFLEREKRLEVATNALKKQERFSIREAARNWVSNLVARRPELQTRYSRRYHHDQAKCEDITVIQAWCKILEGAIAEHGILPEDIYNLDKTGIAMGLCATTNMQEAVAVIQPGESQPSEPAPPTPTSSTTLQQLRHSRSYKNKMSPTKCNLI
ncbi:hypothetical protein PABG_12486 [Paracoccidioides brasiliensis Pb03]|nr:hypothetical protein PABG_12486 [Paracoccidioides brasiliensis Pb03]